MNLQNIHAALTGSMLALVCAMPATAAPIAAHESIPGVSPEPATEGVGLKTPEDLEAFFDGVMAAHLKAQRAPGATVSVVKDGKLFFAKGYGYADWDKQVPVKADQTLFRCGSVSKLFTWTAVMQLVEQGKVSLDADVNTYITQFKLPDTYPGKPVTVRNLLTHTAGFEDGALGFLIVDEAARLDTLAGGLEHHMPARVRPPTTDFNTAENSAYSNWGAALAGLIVEDVSGMPFDDYIEKNIFAPLSMSHSSFRQPVPAALAADLSQSYDYDKGVLTKRGFEFVNIWPAGSLSISATDMANFMIAHLNNGKFGGQQILKPETAELMHARTMSPSPYLNGSGLGFYEEWINGHRLISHGGDLQYFHSDLNLLPEAGVGIFVSYNAAPTLQFSARSGLLSAFMDRYYPAKLPLLKAPDDFKERMAKYAGSYRMNRMSHTRVDKLFSIVDATSVTPTERNTLLISGPVTAEYSEVKPGVFRRTDTDAMVAFSGDDHGKATYLLNPYSLAFIGAYRIAPYETPAMLGLVLGFALLCCVVALVSLVRNRAADRAGPAVARRARQLAAANAVLILLFAVSLGMFVAALVKNPVMDMTPLFSGSRILPLLTVVTTLGMLLCAVFAWSRGWWTRYARVQYCALVLGSIGFLIVANYSNLLGFH